MTRVIGKDTVLTFGKYKGRTGDYVARSDPSYIRFIERNLETWTIAPDLMKLAVNVGMMISEERADAYGTAADWGFNAF